MKTSKNIGMIAVVAFAVGIAGFSFSDGNIALQNDVPVSSLDGASMMGHIEIIHRDNDGNIVTYVQTDNAIMNAGRNCAANMLFGTTANTVCDDQTPGYYNVIALGNGTAFVTDDNTKTGLTAEITGNGLARSDGTNVVSMQGSGATGATGGSAVTRIQNTFTYSTATATNSNTITNAGLFNSTTPSAVGVFALKALPGSGVTMNPGDQLTVNWDITLTGSDDITQ